MKYPCCVSLVALVAYQVITLHVNLINGFTIRGPVTTRYAKACLVRYPMDLQMSAPKSDVVDRLDLTDSFSRWRFLQRLLDGEVDRTDVNEVIYKVLVGFLERPRPKDEVPNERVSPILNTENREIVEGLISVKDEAVLVFAGDHVINEQVLQEFELLLPDPIENDDAHKGAWDTMCEVHGRASVQLNERNATQKWRALSSIARVLIYYDFLTPDWYDYKERAAKAEECE